MADEPEHLLLRRYHAARAQGNDPEAARVWERLTLRNFDRIKGLCATFRFAGGTGLPPHETGSAATEAYLRAIAMGAAFEAREIGQYRAALVRVVWNTCHDYGRKELRHERRSRSLDTTWDDDGEGGPYDAALARYDEHLRAEAEEAAEAEAGREEAERLARWGIAQVRNDNYRAVLELTWLEKLDGPAIARRLDITMDNLYQRRSRGQREMERILRAREP